LISDIDSQAIISFSTLCVNAAENPYEAFALSVLSQLLFDGPSSPFYEAFIESGFAPSFSPGTGFDHQTKEATFSIGVSHIDNKTTFKDVEGIINDTLKRLIEEGFSKEHFDSILHSMVFNQKMTKELQGLEILSQMVP
jgi:presequence protease